MREIIIGQNECGQRLDKLLRKFFKKAGDAFLYKMLRKKNILLNGKKAMGREILSEGDSIKLFFSEDSLAALTGRESSDPNEAEKPFSSLPVCLDEYILYEDKHIIILNKPSGLLSQKSNGSDLSINELCLLHMEKNGELSDKQKETFQPGVVNRLDRNTSGILLFGKTLPSIQILSKLISDRKIKKHYLAVISGILSKGGIYRAYLKKNNKYNQVEVCEKAFPGSSEIRTEFTPIYSHEGSGGCPAWSVLLVHLITGRPHQIRAHLAHLGHPIIGDSKYGHPEDNLFWKRKEAVNSQLLHAYSIQFPEMENGLLSYLSGREFHTGIPAGFLPFFPASKHALLSKQLLFALIQ